MIANKTIMLKELTKQLAFFDEKELSDYYFCRGKDLVRETLDTRRKLIEDGVNCGEKFVENIFVLKKDVIFNSPSTAAVVVLARRANGWTEWKNSNGKTLDEIKRKQQ